MKSDRCWKVPIWVEDVGAVVAVVVLGPLARGAVVAEAGLEGGAVELLDRRAVAGGDARCTFSVTGSSATSANERSPPATWKRLAAPSCTDRPTVGATVS